MAAWRQLHAYTNSLGSSEPLEDSTQAVHVWPSARPSPLAPLPQRERVGDPCRVPSHAEISWRSSKTNSRRQRSSTTNSESSSRAKRGRTQWTESGEDTEGARAHLRRAGARIGSATCLADAAHLLRRSLSTPATKVMLTRHACSPFGRIGQERAYREMDARAAGEEGTARTGEGEDAGEDKCVPANRAQPPRPCEPGAATTPLPTGRSHPAPANRASALAPAFAMESTPARASLACLCSLRSSACVRFRTAPCSRQRLVTAPQPSLQPSRLDRWLRRLSSASAARFGARWSRGSRRDETSHCALLPASSHRPRRLSALAAKASQGRKLTEGGVSPWA